MPGPSRLDVRTSPAACILGLKRDCPGRQHCPDLQQIRGVRAAVLVILAVLEKNQSAAPFGAVL
jgi:hypothetical protein